MIRPTAECFVMYIPSLFMARRPILFFTDGFFRITKKGFHNESHIEDRLAAPSRHWSSAS